MKNGQIFPQGDNPKDPLKKTGPEAQLELLRRFGEASNGFPNDVVIGAAVNLFVNAIRQTYPTLAAAEARYSDIVGQFRTILRGHFDSVTGKRRSIFPHDQVIRPVHFTDKDTFGKH